MESSLNRDELLKKEFFVYTPDGELLHVNEYEYDPKNESLRILVEKEAFKRTTSRKREPDAIRYMKRFGMDWEKMSDRGHMRFQPNGALILELLSDYSEQVVRQLGMPVYPVKGTNIFDLDAPPVAEHAKLFGDRLYSMDIGKKRFVMRYAACHQQFAALGSWEISYKHLPLGVFEVADAYRYEQSGELLLGFRTRKMTMPDLHILTRDIKEAKEVSLDVYNKIFDEWEKELGLRLVNLYNIVPSFFSENMDYLDELLEIEKRPVLLRFVPDNKYYWVINVENHIIDGINNPREIATFQIDIGNAKRFGITYTDEKGEKKNPPIIHTAILGTLERYIYSLFDMAAEKAKKGKPVLPTWLSPTQLRIIPVSQEYLPDCEQLAQDIASHKIRVDIDDRSESVGRRVAKAEKEWVPYVLVYGEKERDSGIFTLRKRETSEELELEYQEIIRTIKNDIGDKPFRDLAIPLHLSKRPIY